MEVARGVNLNPGSPPASGARGLLSQDAPLSTQDSRSKQGPQGPVPSPATLPGWSTPDGAPGTPREVGLSSPEEPPLTAAPLISGFPESSVGKESACNEGDLGSIPGWGRFPWRRKQQPTPVFLPEKPRGQRSLVGCSPWGHREADTGEN